MTTATNAKVEAIYEYSRVPASVITRAINEWFDAQAKVYEEIAPESIDALLTATESVESFLQAMVRNKDVLTAYDEKIDGIVWDGGKLITPIKQKSIGIWNFCHGDFKYYQQLEFEMLLLDIIADVIYEYLHSKKYN